MHSAASVSQLSSLRGGDAGPCDLSELRLHMSQVLASQQTGSLWVRCPYLPVVDQLWSQTWCQAGHQNICKNFKWRIITKVNFFSFFQLDTKRGKKQNYQSFICSYTLRKKNDFSKAFGFSRDFSKTLELSDCPKTLGIPKFLILVMF